MGGVSPMGKRPGPGSRMLLTALNHIWYSLEGLGSVGVSPGTPEPPRTRKNEGTSDGPFVL